jgi:hypothetical protein
VSAHPAAVGEWSAVFVGHPNTLLPIAQIVMLLLIRVNVVSVMPVVGRVTTITLAGVALRILHASDE